MILLDTQVWMWWVAQNPRLPSAAMALLAEHRTAGLAVSRISCWEIAKKIERGKLGLGGPLDDWLDMAEAAPGVVMVDVTRDDFVESTRLPGDFHRDPADQIIVASARIRGLELATTDSKILEYPHVRTIAL